MKRAMTRKRRTLKKDHSEVERSCRGVSQGKMLEDGPKSLGVSLMTLRQLRTEYGSTNRPQECPTFIRRLDGI
jgi:hypothetical protein